MMGVADVVDIRGKTEQRCAAIVQVLQNAEGPLSYDDIRLATGGRRKQDGRVAGGISYDILLFVMAAFVEVGLVQRTKIETREPGHPRVQFVWTKGKARGMGPRAAKAA
jgi:hypothetical protein